MEERARDCAANFNSDFLQPPESRQHFLAKRKLRFVTLERALSLSLAVSLSFSAILYLALPFSPFLSPPSLWKSLYSLSLALIAVPAARKWNLNRSVYCSLDAIITRSVCHHSIMSPSPPSPLTHSTSTLFLGPLRVKFLAFLWNSISKLYHFHLISRFQFASQPTVGIPRN